MALDTRNFMMRGALPLLVIGVHIMAGDAEPGLRSDLKKTESQEKEQEHNPGNGNGQESFVA